jgi:hypothetical protein
MKNIVCLTIGRSIIDHNTHINKSESRGRWRSMVRGRVAFVTTLLVGLILLLLPATGARADTFVVDKVEDSSGPNYYCTNTAYKGNCSLRIAITAASVKSKWGQTNIIVLPAGDYTLNNTLYITGDGDITGNVAPYEREKGPIIIIRGMGAMNTIIHGACGVGASKKSLSGAAFQSVDYDAEYETCDIKPKADGSVGFPTIVVKRAALQLENVTIRDGLQIIPGCGNGKCYATLTNFFGDLKLFLSSVVHNRGILAGGILNMGGSLYVQDSTISQNYGSGEYGSGGVGGVSTIVNGVTDIQYSTINHNFGRFGGGVHNENGVNGGMTGITNSTISNNKTTSGAGGVFGKQFVDCTACHRVSDRGFRDTWLNHVTIVENRVHSPLLSSSVAGGVSGEHVYLTNSIVARNRQNSFSGSGAYVSSPSDCSGRILSVGGNVVGTTSCSIDLVQPLPSPPAKWSGTTCKMRSIDQVVCEIDPFKNADLKGQDPGLGPLADNGGNSCTHALQDGPAVNHGWTGATGGFATPTYDQRWVPRNNYADSGAFAITGRAGQVGVNCTPN